MFALRVPPLTSDSLSNVIESHGGYTLVGVPGHLHHQTVENNLNKVRRLKAYYKRFCWSVLGGINVSKSSGYNCSVCLLLVYYSLIFQR